MTRPRIFLADDHTLLVDAFRKLLEPEFEIVGAASNGRDLLANAPDLRPDLVIVDLGLPLLNGMAAGRELKKLLPRTRILVVTVNEDSAVAHEALREWASGYLLKKSAAAELTYAIREIFSGKSYVAPSVAKKLTEDFIRDPVTRTKGSLTPRQRAGPPVARRRTNDEGSGKRIESHHENSRLPQVQNHGRLRHAQQLGALQTGHTRAPGLYELNKGALPFRC